jgi:hypothetical protein
MSGRYWRDLDTGLGVAPQEGDTGEPVFCVDHPADAGKLLRRQDAGGCGEFGAGDFSADGAGGDLDLRVVADALVFSGFAAGHQVEFVVVFGKPDGRVHGNAIFSEGSEADVTLAADFGGDVSHLDIVNRGRPMSGEELGRQSPEEESK